MTIYTNKKTGITYNKLTELEDNKIQLDYMVDGVSTRSTAVSNSTFKRWYKKETEVDFTSTEAAPDKPVEVTAEEKSTVKPSKVTKKKAAKKVVKADKYSSSTVFLGNFNIKRLGQVVTTQKEFEEEIQAAVTIDKEKSVVTSNAFKVRRLYIDPENGCLFFRFRKNLIEFSDVTV